ncbi:MAG: flagellar motor stator protein MotA [Gammaproteobacteria bacterium]|nr:MAG: flagellar motor stator protein MotA [Gammaproteobacteria bacterium]
MGLIFGFIIVIASVLGGYVLSHGELAALWQPFELIIIGGAAFGAFVIANPPKIVLSVFKLIPQLLFKSRYNSALYLETLAMLFEVFNKIRRDGLIAIESDVDEPESSDIFTKYPLVMRDHETRDFICDYLRMIVVGDMSPFELDNLMDVEIDSIREEAAQPAHAVAKVADALPGFGIVAAVLGIVITMKSLGGPPNELGVHVAAALVGTFLGILMAYGFVGPISQALEKRAHDQVNYFLVIKAALIATINGMPPQVAVEFGRKAIPYSIRPSFETLENRIRHGE